jgi:glucokinase
VRVRSDSQKLGVAAHRLTRSDPYFCFAKSGAEYVIVTTGVFCVLPENSGNVLVFDVGGSHIAASMSGQRNLAVTSMESAAVSKNGSLREFLEIVSSLAKRLLDGAKPPAGVSIAMPNPFDYGRGISYMRHKFAYLYGIELSGKMSQVLGCSPEKISFLNDADAFLMGEMKQGAGRGQKRVVGITLGTGVGSAFAAAGEIVTAGEGVPPGGEIWNLSYKDGIVEKFVSTLAIQENYRLRTSLAEEVQEIANQSDTNVEARMTLEQFGRELGSVLQATCSGFKPERIILGGGISRSASLFLPAAEKELSGLGMTVCVSQLGERAALVGAAVHWIKKHGDISLFRESTLSTGEA